MKRRLKLWFLHNFPWLFDVPAERCMMGRGCGAAVHYPDCGGKDQCAIDYYERKWRRER